MTLQFYWYPPRLTIRLVLSPRGPRASSEHHQFVGDVPSLGRLSCACIRRILRALCYLVEGQDQVGRSHRYATILRICWAVQHHCVLADWRIATFGRRRDIRASVLEKGGSSLVNQCMFNFICERKY